MSLIKVDRQLKDHLDYPDEVAWIIVCRNFDELMNFTNFSLCKLINDRLIHLIFVSGNKIITRYVIDNISHITVYDYGWSLIHFLICYSEDVCLMEYFVNKYHVNLELTNINSKGLNYNACKYIRMDRGELVESEILEGTRLIHLACCAGSHKMIQYLVSKRVDLEAETMNGWKPIHAVCHYQNYETIKYFLSKNLNLATKINCYNDVNVERSVKDLLQTNDKLSSEHKEELLEMIYQRENE